MTRLTYRDRSKLEGIESRAQTPVCLRVRGLVACSRPSSACTGRELSGEQPLPAKVGTKANRMKRTPPKVLIVDLLQVKAPVGLLGRRVTDHDSSSPLLVIRLTSTNVESHPDLQSKENLTLLDIVSTSKVDALYRAKQILDDRSACDITILTSASQESIWKRLGELLFTPVHVWSVEATEELDQVAGNQSDVTRDEQNDVMASLVTYLRGLPSLGKVEYRTSSLIPPHLFTHGFSERNGGISSSPGVRSLSLVYTSKKRDPRLVVDENRRRLGEAVGFDSSKMQMAQAEHGCTVRVLGRTSPDAYDGIITDDADVIVAAPGADCVTLVFADPVRMVVGAAHSGWKGTVKRVAVETVKAMQREYGCRPEDILVAMGPSLETACLEFSREDADGLYAIDHSCVEERPGTSKVFINLILAIRLTLERAGVLPDHIDVTPASACTACHPDSFFSFRRDGVPFGNQCGFIRINKPQS